MNKEERIEIQAVADDAICLGDDGQTENYCFVVDLLVARFEISLNCAREHTTKAAHRKRYPGWGGARVPGPGKRLGTPVRTKRTDDRKLCPVYIWLTDAERVSIRDASTADERRPPLLKLVEVSG